MVNIGGHHASPCLFNPINEQCQYCTFIAGKLNLETGILRRIGSERSDMTIRENILNAESMGTQDDKSTNILAARVELDKLAKYWKEYWKDYENKLGVACYQFDERASVSTLAVAVGRMANAFAISEVKSQKARAASGLGRTDLWVSISDTDFQIEAKQVRNRISMSKNELIDSFVDGKHSLLSQGIRDYLHTTASENHTRIRTRRCGDNWYVMLLISLHQVDSITEEYLRGEIFNRKVNVFKDVADEPSPFDLGRYPTVFSIHQPEPDRKLPGCVASLTILGKV